MSLSLCGTQGCHCHCGATAAPVSCHPESPSGPGAWDVTQCPVTAWPTGCHPLSPSLHGLGSRTLSLCRILPSATPCTSRRLSPGATAHPGHGAPWGQHRRSQQLQPLLLQPHVPLSPARIRCQARGRSPSLPSQALGSSRALNCSAVGGGTSPTVSVMRGSGIRMGMGTGMGTGGICAPGLQLGSPMDRGSAQRWARYHLASQPARPPATRC